MNTEKNGIQSASSLPLYMHHCWPASHPNGSEDGWRETCSQGITACMRDNRSSCSLATKYFVFAGYRQSQSSLKDSLEDAG
ncbi:hypothetical protein EXN66_Car020380 [Channa argus]|uniref:Uncharacterized protein n=1 Tax=Channa argus TaxID=215402 RepID=A0A6G1QPP1_CHAAH|nr:hypothetical protein EXN66_Car020380 [Channa argus]